LFEVLLQAAEDVVTNVTLGFGSPQELDHLGTAQRVGISEQGFAGSHGIGVLLQQITDGLRHLVLFEALGSLVAVVHESEADRPEEG